MAKKKKPYMVFETKEEFDRYIDDLIERMLTQGKIDGFEKGSIWVLSYIQELCQDMFNPDGFKQAEQEIRDRNIEKWRRDNCVESIKSALDKKHDGLSE